MVTLTDRAEQALIGAVLTNAEQVRAAERQSLLADDFRSPAYGRVYAAALDAVSRGEASGQWWRPAVEMARHVGLPPGHLYTLTRNCPEPQHAAAYAALVLEASVRRRLARIAGTLVEGTALLRDNVRRLAAADGTGHAPIGDLARHAARVGTAMRVHAEAFNPDATHAIAGPPLAADGRTRQEDHVLAVLIQQPYGPAEQILGCLTEDAFTGPERRHILRAVKNLHDNGRDIDEVTVDWEAARGQVVAGQRLDSGTLTRPQPGYVQRLAAIDTSAVPIGREAALLAFLERQADGGRARTGRTWQMPPGAEAGPGVARLIQPPPAPPDPGQGPAHRT